VVGQSHQHLAFFESMVLVPLHAGLFGCPDRLYNTLNEKRLEITLYRRIFCRARRAI
jgi:hypothetical protein